MKRRTHTFVLLILLTFASSPEASATVGGKYTTIAEIQFYGRNRIDSPGVVWLKMPGGWGTTTCAADWAWFNGEENPEYVAAALSARATGSSVTVHVDDTYTKLAGYCHVILIAY